MPKQQMGLIGLAVMGKNLAFNIASRGYSLSVYNRTPNKTDELLSESSYPSIVGTKTMEEFVESLESPRKILMMVKAGEPVDQTINQLLPYLSEGDLLIDGGNSFYQDTIRRQKDLASKGFQFIGLGISGGEEGALHGPSLMPGGTKEAYELLE
nr:NADP-dependent phosphogluconate dehydrogenase [Negativicutes bacterium]